MTAGRTNHTAFSSAPNTDAAAMREHDERLRLVQSFMGCHAQPGMPVFPADWRVSTDRYDTMFLCNHHTIKAASDFGSVGVYLRYSPLTTEIACDKCIIEAKARK